jgi:hypothetical protein
MPAQKLGIAEAGAGVTAVMMAAYLNDWHKKSLKGNF